MSIPPESIQVGRCYLTHDGKVRKVTSADSDGSMRYTERTGTGLWVYGGTKKRGRLVFAAALAREVPCDWTSEGDG